MGFLDYKIRPRVMVVGNGHAYDRTAFMAMFESFSGMECFLVEHPLAEQVLNPEALQDVDAMVLFHMPGGDTWSGPGYEVPPTDAAKRGFASLLERGMPIVAMHHAIAAWTLWPDYAEALGGILLHFPGQVRGKQVKDGGYRQNAEFTISAEDPTHPLFKNIPSSFALNDEAYLMEVFEDSISPVARSNYEYTDKALHSLSLAMSGERQSNRGWSRPAGSNVVVWTKRSGNTALAYIQPGHFQRTYENPHYRQLLRNAIEWSIAESRRT